MSQTGRNDALTQALAASPALFPLSMEPRTGAVTLIRLDRVGFERASFLDERVQTAASLNRRVAWDQVAAAAEPLAERCHYIFHIGHVGSTLLSRLLGSHPALFSLREPKILRTFAQIEADPDQAGWRPGVYEDRLGAIVKLLSRTFAPGEIPVVKATSFVSELAAALLGRSYGPRAFLMFLGPERFLAAILGAENSPREAAELAPSRLARLHRRLGVERWALETMSPGEIVAMSWATEMTALAAGAESAGARAMWLDFDRFLADPRAGLRRSFDHLGINAADGEIEAIAAGPEMNRYAKAPEHAYDTALREAVLKEAHEIAGEEIRRGQAWLEAAASAYPAIAAVLDR